MAATAGGSRGALRCGEGPAVLVSICLLVVGLRPPDGDLIILASTTRDIAFCHCRTCTPGACLRIDGRDRASAGSNPGAVYAYALL
jgi:hypothetical protein